ncbi:hypothetical protein D3C71_1614850 [compost metagenome]
MRAFKLHQIGAFNSQRLRIARVKFGERFGNMGGEPRAFAGAGHGMPLIADAAGIQCQRIIGRCPAGFRQGGGDESRLSIGMVKTAVCEKAGNGGLAKPGFRPLKGRHRFVGEPFDPANIEIAASGILEAGKRCMFGENLRCLAIIEGGVETHAPAHLRHLPPVGPCFAGRIEETALAGNAPL